MKVEHFFDLPYADRQIIVFANDNIVEAKERDVEENISLVPSPKEEKTRISTIREAMLRAYKLKYELDTFVYRSAFLAAKGLFDAWKEAKSKGVDIFLVRKSWSSIFSLPPGHPRNNLVYIGHPASNHVYTPIADFHRFVFEHKFSELLSILMNLGATKISVRHIQGWGKPFTSKMDLSIPISITDSAVKASAGTKNQEEQKILYEANLLGTKSPKLPDNLMWYHHENTWQQIANGRLNFGLKNFSLNLQYKEDYGINAGLKAKLEGIGFDLGGEFEKHQSTVWEIQGEFL